jgi:hypothetical protein
MTLKSKKKAFLGGIIILILIITNNDNATDNVNSRIATIESLVNRQTFIIDNSPYATTDKIQNPNNQHFYSSKPPLLSFFGAIIFFLLKNIFQLSLDGQKTLSLAQYLITLIIIGGSFLTLIIFFFKSLQWTQLSENKKYTLTGLFAFSTYLFSYVGTFNNHIPAAMTLFLSFYFILKIKFTQNKLSTNLFWCGVWLGLSGVIDLTSATLLWVVFYFIYFLKNLKNKTNIVWLLVGFTVPVLLHLFLNWQITGDFLPAYMHKSWYNHIGSSYLISQSFPNKFTFIFNILIGHHGLFLYSPILLFSIREIILILKNKQHQLYNEAWLLLYSIIISTILIIFFIPNYGGFAFGFRYFIPFIPLIFFFIIFYLKRQVINTIFIIIALYSIIISIIGTINPWSIKTLITVNRKEYKISFPIVSNLLQLQRNILLNK